MSRAFPRTGSGRGPGGNRRVPLDQKIPLKNRNRAEIASATTHTIHGPPKTALLLLVSEVMVSGGEKVDVAVAPVHIYMQYPRAAIG